MFLPGMLVVVRAPFGETPHRSHSTGGSVLPSCHRSWGGRGEALPSLLQLLQFSDSCLLSVWPVQISSC